MTSTSPAAGPRRTGKDPHFAYGREKVYPRDIFEHHLLPFEPAFDTGTS